jgi:allophanate hydrolase subunit 2
VAAPQHTTGELAVVAGPRVDWFAPDVLDRLTAQAWTVRDASDRVGVRLDGPALERSRDGELPSEPTLPGAMQVPADGRPIVFGPDAPVTGGYPVVAVLTDAALDLAAQVRPGDAVRFRVIRRGSGRG